MQATPNDLDILVEVRCEWNDDATAMYRLDAISRWHWHCVAPGMNTWGTRDFVHGYVMCNEAISGGVFHSCKHGPLPHNIKVCILEKGNEAVWDKIIQCAGPRPRSEFDVDQIHRAKAKRRFRDRDLSGVTINKLIAAGVEAPEFLLFLTPAEIGRLKGIEPAMRREIDMYRSRFGDHWANAYHVTKI